MMNGELLQCTLESDGYVHYISLGDHVSAPTAAGSSSLRPVVSPRTDLKVKTDNAVK